jgi:hypothetical protein
MIFATPALVYGQQCNKVQDENGAIDNMIEINGTIYMLLEVEEARNLLVKVREHEIQTREIELMSQRISLLNQVNDENRFVIEFLERDRKATLDLLNVAISKKEAWYENNAAVFGASFILSSLMYGYWSYMSK